MITLAMAQPVEVAIKQRINSLMEELSRSIDVSYIKGDEPIMPDRTLDEIFDELNGAEWDLLRLRALRDKANNEVFVDWTVDGSVPMTIAMAINCAKNMRTRFQQYKNLAGKNPNPIGSRYESDNITQITYAPADYKAKALQLERQVNALSIAIDRANNTHDLDFDAGAYLEGI